MKAGSRVLLEADQILIIGQPLRADPRHRLQEGLDLRSLWRPAHADLDVLVVNEQTDPEITTAMGMSITTPLFLSACGNWNKIREARLRNSAGSVMRSTITMASWVLPTRSCGRMPPRLPNSNHLCGELQAAVVELRAQIAQQQAYLNQHP